MVDESTGFFDVVNVIGIAQTAFAAQFLCGTTAGGFKSFRFFVGLNRSHRNCYRQDTLTTIPHRGSDRLNCNGFMKKARSKFLELKLEKLNYWLCY